MSNSTKVSATQIIDWVSFTDSFVTRKLAKCYSGQRQRQSVAGCVKWLVSGRCSIISAIQSINEENLFATGVTRFCVGVCGAVQ